MSKAKKERGIEETLRDLAIGDAGDDADEGGETSFQPELPVLQPKGDSRIEIPPPRDDFGMRKQKAINLDKDEDDDDDDDTGGTPFPDDVPTPMAPVLIPSAFSDRGPRAKARDKAPGLKGISKTLADKLPGADKVKVYKRVEGRRWFINDFTKYDLSLFPDAESFLTRYVKPVHGAGEYDIVTVDGLGREGEAGQVRLIEVPGKNTPETGAMALVEKMMNEARSRDQEWMNRMNSTPQQNPLELLAGVMNLKKQLEGEDAGGTSSAVSALAASGDKTMQMMMMMMQQQQQAADRQMQMMMAMMAPKEDPVMKLLLAKLLDGDHGGGGGGGGGHLPPPPPPPASPTSGLAEILTAMAGFMGAMGGGGGGDDDFKEFLKNMLLQKQSEGLGIKDILELVASKNGGKQDGSDVLRGTIDNIAALMNVAQNLNKSNEGGPAAGLFDALAALFSNRDFAGSIAQGIRAKTDQSGATQMAAIQAERQKLAQEARLLNNEKRRLGLVAQHEAAPQAAGRQPAPAQQEAVHTNGSRPAVTPAVVTEAAQREAERAVEENQRIPQLPANTHEHINGILAATDEADLVAKAVTMLIYFAEFEDWRVFSETVLGSVREGNRKQAMNYLMVFFDGIAELGLIDRDRAKTVVVTLNKHFETMRTQLTDLVLAQDSDVTADALLASAEAPAAP